MVKISSNIRNFTNVTQYIPTVCLPQLKYNLKKVAVKNIFFNMFPPLPFTGFTNFTGKFHFFTILPVNLKPGKSSTLVSTLYWALFRY